MYMNRVVIAPDAWLRRRGILFFVLMVLSAAPTAAAAQGNSCSPLHPMVDALLFRGNHAISSRDLASIIKTERADIWRRWLGWKFGPKACVDSTDLPTDAFRISDLYRQRGFPGTIVVAAMVRHGDRRVRVTFEVKESVPLRVDSVTIDSLPENAANVDRLRRFFQGWVLDDSVFTATVDSIQTMVRAAGYAHARAADSTVVRDTLHRRA
jgi:outer membrane protein assembly factor BamA